MKIVLRCLLLFGMAWAMSGMSTAAETNKDPVFRGFMIDAPRGVESMDYYFRLMDFCSQHGVNVIIFRLTDDAGTAMRFTSHPELLECDGALGAEDVKQLVAYAGKKGIEIIPEIESFGHSRYITKTKEHASLNDGPAGKDFNALCPVSDESMALLKDLYAEAAALFPSKYFHIGCDEVEWGASEKSKHALESKSRSQIWADYVNRLNGVLKGMGKETVIWADVPLYKEKDIIDLLDKDLVLVDWNYWVTDKAKVAENARRVLGKGFRLIGSPAVGWCGWGPRVGVAQFKNLNAFAEVYDELRGPNNLGIIVTNWVPKRYLQNCWWDSYTIATEIMGHKGHYNYMDAMAQFVKEHFGAEYNAKWEELYHKLYEATPETGNGHWGGGKFEPWSSEAQVKELLGRKEPLSNAFNDLARLAVSLRGSVTKNVEDFDDLELTLEFMGYAFDRDNALLEFANSGKADEISVRDYLRKVAVTDGRLRAKLDAAWCRGRSGRPDEGEKNSLWQFQTCAAYSVHLSEHPEEFIALLKER